MMIRSRGKKKVIFSSIYYYIYSFIETNSTKLPKAKLWGFVLFKTKRFN